jgi:hypothetical protein
MGGGPVQARQGRARASAPRAATTVEKGDGRWVRVTFAIVAFVRSGVAGRSPNGAVWWRSWLAGRWFWFCALEVAKRERVGRSPRRAITQREQPA